MIRGIGIDVADIGRFRQAAGLQGFLEQFLTAREIGRVTARGTDLLSVTLLFSAKEALVKALGCGMSGGWRWHDIEVSDDFRITLAGRLGELAAERSVSRILVSHSSYADHAVTLVLLDG